MFILDVIICSLGLFGKSLIDEPTSATGALRGKDAVLLGVLALVILVGSFATQLAASTWQEIQDEIKVFSNEKV